MVSFLILYVAVTLLVLFINTLFFHLLGFSSLIFINNTLLYRAAAFGDPVQ